MPIDTSSAAAIVRFSGLGVLCFNDGAAENLFLHEAGHTLTVEIFKPLVARIRSFYSTRSEEAAGLATFKQFPYARGTRGEPLDAWYKRVAVYDDIDVSQLDTPDGGPPLDVSVDISAEGTPAMASVGKYPPVAVPFDRVNDIGDENDFKWIVNVTASRLTGTPTHPLTTSVPTSRLNIRNAMFYTHSRAADENHVLYKYKRVERDPGRGPGITSIADYGAINDEIGAKIDSNDGVRVVVNIGSEAHTHLLPKLDLPYVIYIKNNAAVSGSDMPIYQKLFRTTGPLIDLLTDAEINTLGDSSMITGREFCSGIYEEFPPHD